MASLPGCNLVFTSNNATGSDASTTIDGSIPNDGTITPDGTIVPSPVFGNAKDTGLQGGDPTFGADLNELWYVVQAMSKDLQSAKQSAAGMPYFDEPRQASVVLNGDEGHPALTANGELMAFASIGNAAKKVYLAQRPPFESTFSAISESLIQLNDSFAGLDMSQDGLRLYVIDGTNLLIYTHATATERFTLSKTIPLPATKPRDVSVSSNESEILFNDPAAGGRIVHARLSADGLRYENPTAFQVGEPCSTSFADANFSNDNNTVVYTCDGNIHIASRIR